MKTKLLCCLMFLAVLAFLILFAVYAGMSAPAAESETPDYVQSATYLNRVYSSEDRSGYVVGVLGWSLVGISCLGVVLFAFMREREHRRSSRRKRRHVRREVEVFTGVFGSNTKISAPYRRTVIKKDY